MLTILGIIFPIFAMIGLGYLLVWREWFGAEDLKVLGRFVVNIALPALLFNAVTQRDLSEILVPGYLVAYAAAGLMTLATIWIVFSVERIAPSRRAVGLLGSACPNSGYVGYPVLALALPAVAEPAFAMNVMVENFVMLPICLGVIQSINSQASGLNVVRQVIRETLHRPLVIGLLAGLVVSLSGLTIPAPFARLVEMISSTTAGLALFIIGGSLVGLPIRGNLLAAFQTVGAKLVVHPLFAVLTAGLALVLGFGGPDGDLRAALILSAAMPMLGTYAVFAQEVGHEGMASIALLGATVASFFTLTGLLWFLT